MSQTYITNQSGPNIDKALARALAMNPDSIGCVKLESTTVAPIDMNTITIPGSYTTDFIDHGPLGIGNIRPIRFDVYVVTSNGTDALAQSISMADSTAIRSSANGGADWTDWNINVKSQFADTTGDLVDGRCPLYQYSSAAAIVSDKAEFILKIHAPNASNAKISVNGSTPYAILNSRGLPLTEDDYVANSYIDLIFSGIPWNITNSNASTVGKFYTTGVGTNKSDSVKITEAYDRFHAMTGYNAEGENSDWFDIDSSQVASDRVLISHEYQSNKKVPRRVIMSNMTLKHANALAKLDATKTVNTDSEGYLTSGIESKYVNALKDISQNIGKILCISKNGVLSASEASANRLSLIDKILPQRIVSTDASGYLTDSGVSSALLAKLGSLDKGFSVAVDDQGYLITTKASKNKLDSLGELSVSKMVMTDVNGNLKSTEISSSFFDSSVTADVTQADPTIDDFDLV